MNFSVLIPVYNKVNPVYLKHALDSVWTAQTLKPSEIVIVEDGPINKEIEETWFLNIRFRLDRQDRIGQNNIT